MLRFITLSGFLGAGKTTTMTRAAALLRGQGLGTAVVTNDQGDALVDSATASGAALPAREVTGGCFCCRFEDLVQVTIELTRERALDVIIAEAVGSCTDVTATVVRPLRAYYGDRLDVAPLTTVVDPVRYFDLQRRAHRPRDAELGWLFGKQLEDAEIIALNKVDLYPSQRIAEITDELRERYPHATVHPYSATTGEGLDGLIDLWKQGGGLSRSATLDIDYERYGVAEALLGWLDRRVILRGRGDRAFDLDLWAYRFLQEVDARCSTDGHTVGHVKVWLHSERGDTRGNLVGAGSVALGERQGTHCAQAEGLINARVACDPDALGKIVDEAVEAACSATGSVAETVDGTAFVPGQPTPTHRMTSVG